MKVIFKFSIILLTTILFFSSCRKDTNESDITNVNIPGPEIINLINGDLDVYITDINGNSLQDVDVFVYDEKLRTDKYGIVQFKNIPLDGNGTFVRAIIPGYFFGSDKFFPKGTDNSIVIRLLPLDSAKEIDPSSASQIQVDGGGSISFQANSFVDNAGDEYSGTVKVYAKRINPEDPFSHEVMPGNLLGLNERGNTVVLESYAMLAVELRDKDGNELQLKEGSPATVSFKVDEKLHAGAPQFIPTWSFDENGGNWIEEGEAEFIDGNYVAEVAHFSFWNCDAPFPLVNITGSVVDQDGNPQEGFYVLVKANGMCGAGYTNSEGVFSGKMPKNQQLTFCVFAPGCADPIYTVTLGPFTENTILDPFVLQANTSTYSGIVLCEGEPLADAEIYLIFPNINEKYFSDENGEFSIDVQEINCLGIGEGTLFALNPATNIISEMIPVNENSLDNIELEVCVDCDVSPYFTEEDADICGGSSLLQINIDNTTTEYLYEWSNGVIGDEIEVSTSGTYCVTITEPITECFLTLCEDVVVSQPLQVFITSSDITCFDNGFAIAEVTGGTSPYTFSWSGPNFIELSDNSIQVFSEGEYVVVITDANGCSVTDIIYIQEEFNQFDLPIFFTGNPNSNFPIICDGESVTLYIDCDFCNIDTNFVDWILPDGTIETGGSITVTEPGYYQASYFDGLCEYYGGIDVGEAIDDYEFTGYQCEIYYYGLEFTSQSTNQMFYEDLIDSFMIFNFPESFEGTVQTPNPQCGGSVDYSIPYASGVEIVTIESPTCDTCEDGFIEVNVDNFDCLCNLGSIVVVSENNIYNFLELNSLGSGTYYLLVLNEESECMVYAEEFVL